MSKPKPVVVLATGGTGGHVFPAQALAESLLRQNVRVAILTDRRGRGFLQVPPEVKIYELPLGTITGSGVMRFAKTLWAIARVSLFTFKTLRRLKPRLVVGFGGYPSATTMLCATLMRTPKMIHEQNAVLGRTNRILARFVKRIALSFRHTLRVPQSSLRKARFTGMPVRKKIKALAKHPYDTPTDTLNLLIIGGSQGARIFSDVLPKALALMKDGERARLYLTQQCRPEDLEATQALYKSLKVQGECAPFFEDMENRFGHAHLVIGRSGSSTVSEIIASKRPSILVPYAFATDNHQLANAQQIEQVCGGWVLEEPDFTPQRLVKLLRTLLDKPEKLTYASAALAQLYAENATDALAKEVENLLSKT